MAQYRQAGTERFGVRSHDFHHGNGSAASDQFGIGIRGTHKQGRARRSGRPDKGRRISVGALVVILCLVLVVTGLAYCYLSRDKELNRFHGQDDKNDLDFLANVSSTRSSKVLDFGQGSVSHGRDSRYWDRDDRRRDDEYNEDDIEINKVGLGDNNGSMKKDRARVEERSGEKQLSRDGVKKLNGKQILDHGSGGLYNEAGRDELKQYEEEFEASLKNIGQSGQENRKQNELSDGADSGLQDEDVDPDDEYDDGIDSHDARMEDYNDARHDGEGQSDMVRNHDDDTKESSDALDAGIKHRRYARQANDSEESFNNSSEEDSLLISQIANKGKKISRHTSVTNAESNRRSSSGKKSDSKRRAKHRKISGSSCEMKFLNSTAKLVEPLESHKFSRFSLQYTEVEERPSGLEHWKPRFSGYQSLQEREESFIAHDQKINCGFIKGPKGYPSTGFDLAEDDARFMSSCHIAVSSCIFGNSDNLRTPTGKTVTRLSRKNVCFVIFMDENTLKTLSSEGQQPDRMGFIGLWKVVVVKNLPYTDMRRVGKIPKFLTHRLFPSARYSIWLDSKLRLQNDPLLILEYFLWRKGYEYAISNHYDRHCLWEEVAQNKKLNKYNHTIIDQQFTFYQADGLRRFNASDPNRLLPSYVPEGSFIVRAHTPMSNLFSCLWFNEVDRFTPRDQLSFAYTYLKLRRTNPRKPFYLNMFKDCERRAIAKLYHHRSEEKRNLPLQESG
ncbi:uncharacterized protein LOC122661577 isoform X2 [Telopea speciosissima]|uniref:uncharacterized protein LOC122661577 isoform X2 n=1 Tax=Telopea speciosissima TaxID=54955 RepID=UPI001CC68217|nr:uncharacterized protein LOC122661577 isoform X2 [Telopea speciosissima]